jgi:hypothetical protein
VNPFTVSGSANPLVLVNGGSSGATKTPGSAGGVVLLPGAVISTNVPWIVPGDWSLIGQGGHVTVLAPSSTFGQPSTSGMVSTTGTTAVTGSGTGWLSPSTPPAGAVLLVCGAACAATYSNPLVVGVVTDWATNTTLRLGTAVQATVTGTASNYTFLMPLITWATTTACTSCNGGLQNQTIGSVIQDMGLDCSVNQQGGTFPAGCIPFWDQYGQERSQLKRVRIADFNIFGIGIYTIMAQNGGPFDDIQMSLPSISSNNICVEVGGNGVGGQPPMRGIRGLTCTGPAGSSSVGGTGIDINTQNFSLSDAHLENFSNGVNIGSVTSARGIFINDVSGGGSGTGATVNVVNINNTCATGGTSPCQSFATSDITVSNVFQPLTTAGPALDDMILSRSTSEATLGFYSLGDGTTTGGVNNRPVLTTSSSFGSSPNLLTMAAGTPITGVQGSTGTFVQMSTGAATTSGHIGTFDASSNLVDSGIASLALATSGQGGIWLPTVQFPEIGLGGAVVGTTIKAIQFVLPTKITFTKFSAWVITSSTGSFNLAIYNSAGTRVAESTALSCGTAGAAVGSSISAVTLQPGIYYFSYGASDATCAIASLGNSPQSAGMINRVNTREGTTVAYTNPLPATLGSITSANITPAEVFIEP